MNNLPAIHGLYTALVTPFTRSGELDKEAFSRLMNAQRDGGTDGVVICGTTGESPNITEAEFGWMLDTAVAGFGSELLIIAGTGTNSTQKTIDRSKLAQKHGAHALLLAAPYYNKPTQKGLYAHYSAVADAVDLPQIIYNVPGRTAVNILPDTINQLARHQNIVAVKEASGDINQIMDVVLSVPGDFSVLAGDDAITLPVLAAGGAGVISVISNQAPAQMRELVHAGISGDFDTARKMHYRLLPLMKANFWESNPIVVKAALSYMGLIENTLRLPLVPMSERFETELKTILRTLKLVQS